ncbi:MAG: HAD-IB family hydrolase [Xanthomonadales bacterium]|jgi:HAD superfamily hydrolase (TIGR01490 family)|nr:HAD-IB family hydrolase [Xanthomonadales bacterium]
MDLALFDFDSTITTRDTFADFIRYVAPRSRRLWGNALLLPLLVGYRLGVVSGHVLRASAVRVGLGGLTKAEAHARGEAFAVEVLEKLLRTEVMARIDWHRQRGDRVVVVSGALDLYLAPWCRRHGLEVLCSTLAVQDGRLTGAYRDTQCVAEEKARRVHALLKLEDYGQVHAYGDSPDDHALLRLAHHASYRGRPWRA